MIAVTSPCVRNCCLNNSDICLGCFRSLDEILLWGSTDTSNDQKQYISNKAKKRKQDYEQISP
ncbi:MAG: DUF1289 domain-containing protein [Methylophaga sp.]|nr:MAG: DUF1289 domain-containing protein [Methylophaga sp.]